MIIARRHTAVLITSMLLLTAPQTSGAKSKFTLAKAVAADCWLYVHWRDNPELDFLDKHISRVIEAVKAAHIERDIKNLVMNELQSEEDRAKFAEHWDQAAELFNKVNWSDLLGQEAVLASRQIFPQADLTLLFKPRAETLPQNVEGLTAILQELANLDDEFSLVHETYKGAKMWTLTAQGTATTINMFQHNKIVGFSLGRGGAQAAISLLAGERPHGDITDSPRYREALAGVPAPEDLISFVDTTALNRQFRQVIEINTDPLENAADKTSTTNVQPGAQLVNTILDHFDFIDYVISSSQTEGLQSYEHTVAKLTETGKDKPLCKILTHQKPLHNFVKYVPKDAKGYWAWSGLDLEAAYDLVIDFIGKNLPNGPEVLTRWEEFKTESGFDPKVEFLSWLEGQMVSVTFSPAFQSPFAKSDWVWMIKVNNDQKASETINNTLDSLLSNSQSGSPGLLTAPAADVHADGFRSLTHPVLAMLMTKITYGVHDGWLMVSNSTAAINKTLASANGEAPSFLENERFKKEGLVPRGPVASASFADMSTFGQDSAMAMGMISMSTALIPLQPGSSSKGLKAVSLILGKLAPAVSKIDFILSSSSICTFEGDRWVTKKVMTYREYVPPAERKPPATPQSQHKQEKKRRLDGL